MKKMIEDREWRNDVRVVVLMEVWVRDGGGDGGDGVDWGRKRKTMSLDFGRRRWRFLWWKKREKGVMGEW